MVTQDRDNVRRSKRKTKLDRYWYLDGELHRTLHINRGQDLITAWNYPQHKRIAYNYTAIKRKHQRAFKTLQVCEMLNRTRLSIQFAIMRGDIAPPQKSYNLETGNYIKYFWREEDIIGAQRYFASKHFGRPRNDGLITPKPIPTELEIRALIRHNQTTYVKVDGDFVPTWQAEDM